MTNDNKKLAAPDKSLYNNIDFLGFESLTDLMGDEKLFLDLEKCLVDLERRSRSFWKVLRVAECAENFIIKYGSLESACVNRAAKSMP